MKLKGFARSAIKLFRPLIIFTMRSYWFVTRPTTQGAKVVIVCGGEILLVKPTYGYKYTLPGGGVKKGESPEAAAQREALEEVGIVLKSLVPLESFVTNYEYKKDTVHGFYAETSSKDFSLNDLEIDLAEWHPLSNLPHLGPVTARIVAGAIKKIG